MLELVAMLSLEVNEKEQAPLGQRIRAVGMCFYKKGDLKKGNNYQLRRNRDNPKDTVSRFGAGISRWSKSWNAPWEITISMDQTQKDWVF